VKAVVHDKYGPPEVLRLEDVDRPTPKDDEVLVQIHATTVSRSDCGYRSGHPSVSRLMSGVRRPKRRILGQEFAGEVMAVGSAVTEFEVGDRVFGAIPAMNIQAGTYAEFTALPESAPMARMPDGMSFEDAAAVCDGAILAINCLKPAQPLEGKRVLVYGASGSIGTAGVQLAKHFGAHVTAVCNTKNVELVRSLGADEVIDYLKEDFTKNGDTSDVIFDAVGKLSFGRCKASLRPGGSYLPTDGFANLFWFVWTSRIGDRRVLFELPPRYKKDYVVFVKELIEAGEYRAVVDRSYPLEDVIEATKYVETEQKTGNVVLTVGGGHA
jgi:NADPH:quinone reductase-like Zn-dependent oxidoreductase